MTVSLPVRGCVQDETCTRDGVTGPGFTLSGSCCQGSRCNSDLRNRTYFSPRITPLVLLPPPTPTAPATRVQNSSSTPTTATPTPAAATVLSTTAPASHSSPREVAREAAQGGESRLTGGAAGHQDRSNMGTNSAKGKPQMPTGEASAALGSGLSALLLTVVAAAVL